MKAYSQDYLNDVVENQGKLFDFVAQTYPDKDTEDFIKTYMVSKTEKVLMRQKPMSTQWTPKNCGNTLPKQKNIP